MLTLPPIHHPQAFVQRSMDDGKVFGITQEQQPSLHRQSRYSNNTSGQYHHPEEPTNFLPSISSQSQLNLSSNRSIAWQKPVPTQLCPPSTVDAIEPILDYYQNDQHHSQSYAPTQQIQPTPLFSEGYASRFQRLKHPELFKRLGETRKVSVNPGAPININESRSTSTSSIRLSPFHTQPSPYIKQRPLQKANNSSENLARDQDVIRVASLSKRAGACKWQKNSVSVVNMIRQQKVGTPVIMESPLEGVINRLKDVMEGAQTPITLDAVKVQSEPTSFSGELIHEEANAKLNTDSQTFISAIETERANVLESRLNEAKSSEEQARRKLKMISDELSRTPSSKQSSNYETCLSIVSYFQQLTSQSTIRNKRGPDEIIQSLERFLNVMPNTNLHAQNQETLKQALIRLDFIQATSIVKDVYKTVSISMRIAESEQAMEDSFDELMYVLDTYKCMQSIEQKIEEEARRHLTGGLYAYIRRLEKRCNTDDNAEARSVLVSQKTDYCDLCIVFLMTFDPERTRSWPFFESVLETYSPRASNTYENWNWERERNTFWKAAEDSYHERYTHEGANKYPAYALFISEYFIARKPKYPWIDQLIIAAEKLERIKGILDDSTDLKVQQSCEYVEPKAVSLPHSASKKKAQSEMKQTLERKQSGKINADRQPQSDHTKSSVSSGTKTTEYKQILRHYMKQNDDPVEEQWNSEPSKPEITAEIIQTSGPLQGKVEVMDAILDPTTSSVIVAVGYKEKKLISFYDLSSDHILAQYRTRKPVTTLMFYRSNNPANFHSLLLFSEFKDVVLLDWRQQQVLKRWNLHRNVVLQLDFVPQLKARFGKPVSNLRQLGISLAFDHSIKIWDLSDQNSEPRPVDKIHSSSGQPFSSFCFRVPDAEENPELIVAQEKGIFRVYKLRSQGSLHLVNTLAVDVMKYSSKVTHMNPDPHQPHLVLVACESDNKIFILDMNQGEILKQLSGRFFVTDKHAASCFSPKGSFVVCGSLPQTTQAVPRPPSHQPRHDTHRRPSPYAVHRANLGGHEQAQNMNLRSGTSLSTMANAMGTFLWNTTTGKLIRSIEFKNIRPSCLGDFVATHTAWLPLQFEREQLVLCSSDGRILLVDVELIEDKSKEE